MRTRRRFAAPRGAPLCEEFLKPARARFTRASAARPTVGPASLAGGSHVLRNDLPLRRSRPRSLRRGRRCAACPPAAGASRDARDVPLVDQNGTAFTLRDLHRPTAVIFVATRCGDACPIAEGLFARLAGELAREHVDARLLTVTLDPDVDRADRDGDLGAHVRRRRGALALGQRQAARRAPPARRVQRRAARRRRSTARSRTCSTRTACPTRLVMLSPAPTASCSAACARPRGAAERPARAGRAGRSRARAAPDRRRRARSGRTRRARRRAARRASARCPARSGRARTPATARARGRARRARRRRGRPRSSTSARS